MNRSPTANRKSATDPELVGLEFVCYCLFVISYFLHLGNRIPLLGAMRIDIVLAGLAFASIVLKQRTDKAPSRFQPTTKLLIALGCYIVVTLPLVRWPGSVIDRGWDPFVKAISFYILTVATVTTPKRLQWFLAVFIGVQVLRVLEPLYLHMSTGYWGSFTDMGNYEFMNRLSGAPDDIVNPNGLAFIIVVALSLLHYVLGRGGRWQKLAYFVILGPLLYAMMLTGSRSGVVVLALFALMLIWRSKHRVAALVTVSVIIAVLLASISDLERQRYLSIVDSNAKGAATAQGRVAGLWADLAVGLERPLFGHGLGTSAEANYNTYGEALPSHTLYTEVLQELGLIGLAIFTAFIVVTCKNCAAATRLAAAEKVELRKDAFRPAIAPPRDDYLERAAEGIRDFAILLVVFSIASYGLNEYQWYFLAGLSVVLRRILEQRNAEYLHQPVTRRVPTATFSDRGGAQSRRGRR